MIESCMSQARVGTKFMYDTWRNLSHWK